jgi:putative PEP-CTERM system histidine kinase
MKNAISILAIMFAGIVPVCLLSRQRRHRLPYGLAFLLLLAATLEGFDLMGNLHPADLSLWKRHSLAAEALLAPAWLWFSLTYARQTEPGAISLPQRLLLAASVLFALVAPFLSVSALFYSPDFATDGVLFLNKAGLFFYLFLLIFLTKALINLEMTLANAGAAERYKIKFELLGSGVLLAVMIFYYSQGIVFRALDVHIAPVRTVVLIVSLAMITYSRLKRGNGVKIHISRHMAYQSFVLLTVGTYLLGLGLLGEGLNYYGDGFRRTLMISVAFLGGLGLVLMLLSETAKRKIRVFIHKNFYQQKYDYRTQWLQFTDRLSSSQSCDELPASIVAGFCDTFGMECGAIFLLNQDRAMYQQISGTALEADCDGFAAREPALTEIASRNWVADLRQEAPKLQGEKLRQFFAANHATFVIPLLVKQELDGFIMLGKPVNRQEIYRYEDFDLMKTLARQATSALLNIRLSDQLARSREMAAIGKVSAFVVHDLKNLVSTISLMLENAKEYMAEPEFQAELLRSLTATVEKMNGLIQRLKKLPEQEASPQAPIDLLELVNDTAALVKGGDLRVTGTSVVAEGNKKELQQVALNLMLNAVEASAGKQPVTVEVGNGASPFIRVRDNGCGISKDFMLKQLFTPFNSTKRGGLGIGLYQCKQIVEAHGGTIEVTSELNGGSEFTVWLKASPYTLSTGL